MLENIHYSPNEAYPGDVIEVTCDDGYKRIGPGNITCKQDETFDVANFPLCKCKLN